MDTLVRPASIDEMIGQTEARERLLTMLRGRQIRGKPPSHCLFTGPPGTGKTTLAGVISAFTGTELHVHGPESLADPHSLAVVLAGLKTGDVLFIDEIHGLKPRISDLLLTAMEDGRISVKVGTGRHKVSRPLALRPFTLVGATTEPGKLKRPLIDRFGFQATLTLYSAEELALIVERAASKLGALVSPAAAQVIGERARGTARIALSLLDTVWNHAVAKANTAEVILDEAIAIEALNAEADSLGLDARDLALLRVLCCEFPSSPVGVKPLATMAGEDEETVRNLIEPWLLRCGLIKLMPNGRIATRKAYEHLGLTCPIDVTWL